MNLKLIRSIIFAIPFLIPVQASSDIFLYPRKYVEYMIVCTRNVNCEDSIALMKDVQRKMSKEFNLVMSLIAVAHIDMDVSGSPPERGAKWMLLTESTRIAIDPDFTLVFNQAFPDTGEIVDFESEMVLGAASHIGCVGDVDCMAYVRMLGSFDTRFRLVLHELGHLLGATHTMGGIMHASAEYAQTSDKYSIESIREIQDFVSTLP